MRKICVLIITALLLGGCVEYSGNLQSELNTRVSNVANGHTFSPNLNHKYYSFYLPPEVGRIDSYQAGNVFTYNGNKFVMNVSYPSIISNNYYDGSTISKPVSKLDLVASNSGIYDDFYGENHNYSIEIYKYQDVYYTYFRSDYLDFFSSSSEIDSVILAEKMYEIAKSVKVNEDLILAAFSKKETIDYTRKKVELFQNIAPESGAIEELFVDYIADTDSYMGDNLGEIPEYSDDVPIEEEIDPNMVEYYGDDIDTKKS